MKLAFRIGKAGIVTDVSSVYRGRISSLIVRHGHDILTWPILSQAISIETTATVHGFCIEGNIAD